MCMFLIFSYTLFVLSIPHLKEWAFRTFCKTSSSFWLYVSFIGSFVPISLITFSYLNPITPSSNGEGVILMSPIPNSNIIFFVIPIFSLLHNLYNFTKLLFANTSLFFCYTPAVNNARNT